MNANGTAIRALRKDRHMSLTALAKAAGYSQGYLSRLERGEVGASGQTLNAIAEQLDVEVTDLTRGDTMAIANSTDEDLRLYTAEQVHELTGLPVRWLKRSAGEGRIPCTKVGIFVRFSAKNIRELIEDNEIDPRTGLRRSQLTTRRRSA